MTTAALLSAMLLAFADAELTERRQDEGLSTRCSLNGRYENGRCSCSVAWDGDTCELLSLLPTPAGADYDRRATAGLSSWGASIVQLPRQPEVWHMFVSELLDGCGVTSWQTNSQIVHATAAGPMGPWTRKGVALHPWSHCGTVAVAPDGTMIQPRLWCSPVKYPNGTGSCNAGVRSTIPSGMPNAGQRCVGGASPCGFRLHEGQWEPCRNSTDRSGAAKLMPADSDMRGVGRRASADAQPCVPGQPASVSFAVTRQAAGEWIENFTAPIVGPNSCPRSHSLGTNPPWIMVNGTTFILVLPQIIRADAWNASYTVFADNISIPGKHRGVRNSMTAYCLVGPHNN
jgi:hypothetical protein